MKITTALAILLLPVNLLPQAIRHAQSAAYLGPGDYSNTHVDVFSFEANQAALVKVKTTSAGIYGEKRFLLTELGLYEAAVAVPTPSGNFGFDARYFGFSDYNESQLGLAYARSLGTRVNLGAQFNYYHVHLSGYGNDAVVNFEVGTILKLTDKLNAGIHVYNPVGGRLGKESHEKLGSAYSAGMGYEASPKFFLSLDIEKNENEPVDVNAGMQYKIISQLLARMGFSAATSSVYFGIGFIWKSFRLDATASYHPQLGITPGLLLIYNAIKEEN